MWYLISANYQGQYYPEQRYLYYSKREAIKRYREKFGLVGKRVVLDVRRGSGANGYG